jgi:NAD(P)-dependent dehydrogenase (short-subunit alcohol dehydrogenase family)
MVHRVPGTRELDGQIAIVTGAGRGIGRTIAISLAENGMRVALWSRTLAQLEETAEAIGQVGGEAVVNAIDISDLAAVEDATASITAKFGPIDLLVNNAGVSTALGFFHEVQAAAWWREVEINFRGPTNCVHAVLPTMLDRHSGRIVNVISASSFRPRRGQTAYCASKSALEAFTEHLATETGPEGVQVFSLSPGLVHTQILDDSLVRGIPEMVERIRTNLDNGRDISPQRAADVILAIARGEADVFAGRFIDASEDFEAMLKRSGEIVDGDLYVVRDRR